MDVMSPFAPPEAEEEVVAVSPPLKEVPPVTPDALGGEEVGVDGAIDFVAPLRLVLLEVVEGVAEGEGCLVPLLPLLVVVATLPPPPPNVVGVPLGEAVGLGVPEGDAPVLSDAVGDTDTVPLPVPLPVAVGELVALPVPVGLADTLGLLEALGVA